MTDGAETRVLEGEAATARLAGEIAAHAAAGDAILLSGDLGAGKTTLARALIRAVAEDDRLEVPSPTFTLVQHYALPRLDVVHVDLYRIGGEDELDELGVDAPPPGALVLIEWPERATGRFAGDRLEIALTMDAARPHVRRATLTGHGTWGPRLERMGRVRGFLDAAGLGGYARRHLQGDASTRRYERLVGPKAAAILMDAPARPDPGTAGVPAYSRVAHLAEDVVPFAAMARGLLARGVSAPRILAADLDAGLLALEDLGSEGVVDAAGRPLEERYLAAAELLAALHAMRLPRALEAGPGVVHRLPAYDLDAYRAETSLLLDWFVPHALGGPLQPDARAAFAEAWDEILAPLADAAPGGTWVLRDFHSPNLMWLPDRHGIARVGVVDFQDAVLGPAAYDVASLATDARVDVDGALSDRIVARYAESRRVGDPDFDAERFARELAILIAQRNTKILGIFARLAVRDAKPRYLAHIPRVSAYLDRALRHPVLRRLALWYDTHLPAAVRASAGTAPDGP